MTLSESLSANDKLYIRATEQVQRERPQSHSSDQIEDGLYGDASRVILPNFYAFYTACRDPTLQCNGATRMMMTSHVTYYRIDFNLYMPHTRSRIVSTDNGHNQVTLDCEVRTF